MASTLNIGAFNLGNAGGAWLGGAVIDAGQPLTNVPLAAAAVAVVALLITAFSYRLERRSRGAALSVC